MNCWLVLLLLYLVMGFKLYMNYDYVSLLLLAYYCWSLVLKCYELRTRQHKY
jgi:hypothetical protein